MTSKLTFYVERFKRHFERDAKLAAKKMASQLKWGFQFKENKLYILLNRAPMRKPNGEEYSSVTYIERGNSAIQVKVKFPVESLFGT